MGIKYGKGSKVNGKVVQEKIQKKIITCTKKECSFGKVKIDDHCAICQFRKDYLYLSKIEPVLIEVKDQYIIKECHTRKGLPLYDKCPFGFKEVSVKCQGCARTIIQNLSSETKEIK